MLGRRDRPSPQRERPARLRAHPPGEAPVSERGWGGELDAAELEVWLETRQPGAARQVLVVDDDAGFREVLAGLLADRGHAVVEARDGSEALASVAPHRFDLVFLDIHLGTSSGAEVFRALQARDPAAEVVLVTGYPDHPEALAALALGPVCLLRKPFHLADLAEILDPEPIDRASERLAATRRQLATRE